MSTNENMPISGQFWDWMRSYWHTNRDFPPAHPDWRKKADLVDGKVPAGQLPSYVDDVLEFSSYADLPQSGEKGKIYITTKDNKQFRWGGSAYIEINSGEKVESKIINGSYNANDLNTNSITYGYSVANAPSTVGAHSFTVLNLDTTNPDYKMQLGFDGDTNEMFSRIKSNGNWSDWSKYAASSQLENVVTTNTNQGIYGYKEFYTSGGANSYSSTRLKVAGFTGNNAIIGFNSFGAGVGTMQFNGDQFYFTKDDIESYAGIKSGGFVKNGSDDNYVLLGGGHHKLLSELGSTHSHQFLHSSDTGSVNANSLLEDYKIKFNQRVENASTNMFPMIDNANAVLSIASHPGGYGGQLGFNDNEQVFFRGVSAGNYGTWKQFAFKDWVDNNYLALKGGALSGDLTLKVLKSDTLNGNQIVNAGNQNQLYFGNPTVDTVYHESGNNHIFSNRGNASLTIDSNGNVTAKNAVNAGNDSEIGGRLFGKRTVIDTLGLDESKYYPVVIRCNTSYPSTIKVYRTLDASMGVPSYSSHGGGFWCYYEFQVYGNGWGINPLKAICNYEDESWVNHNIKVVGYDQMGRSSNVVIYLRGGSKYWFDINSATVPTLYTSPFTVYDETVEPTKSRIWSGGILMNANASDIHNAVNGLENTLKDYVTVNTEQSITKRKIINKDLGTNDYINVAQHNAQFQIGKSSDAKSLEFAVTDDGISYIQSKEVGIGYNPLILNRANNGGVSIGGLPVTGHGLTVNGSTYTVDGYYKQGYDNNYILLAGGGQKVISDFVSVSSLLEYYKKVQTVYAINAYDADPLNSFNELNGKTQIGSINADGGWWHIINIQHRNGVGDGVNYSGQLRFGMTANTNTMQFRQQYDGKWLPWKTIWNSDNFNPAQYVLQSSLSSQLANYFNKFAIDYIGASHDLNSLSQTGFYNVGHGTVGDATSYLNNTGAKALLHLQSEDTYTALQIQSHRYNGNLISRSKSDGVFSTWIRHWGDNDFTTAEVSKWNNSLSTSSASEEVILEDDTLKIQPDEFSLEGSGSYDIGSKKKLVHILLREGKEVNIRDITRRQTIVVFNFSKNPINLNIEGLKPYPLSPEMQVTLYISDEGEVMLYNENSFKKLQ